MDGWVNVSGTVTHHATAGAASPVVTWEPAGLERLSRDKRSSFLPWPSGFDEQTRFIPTPVLTTDSNHCKETNLVTAADGLFECRFSIVTLSSLLLLMTYHHSFEGTEEHSRCFPRVVLLGSRWKDPRAERVGDGEDGASAGAWGALLCFLCHTHANATAPWRDEPFHTASSSSGVQEG